jgi:hypothetical protein
LRRCSWRRFIGTWWRAGENGEQGGAGHRCFVTQERLADEAVGVILGALVDDLEVRLAEEDLQEALPLARDPRR